MKGLKTGLLKLFYKTHAELVTPPGLPKYSDIVKIFTNDSDINKLRLMILNNPTIVNEKVTKLKLIGASMPQMKTNPQISSSLSKISIIKTILFRADVAN